MEPKDLHRRWEKEKWHFIECPDFLKTFHLIFLRTLWVKASLYSAFKWGSETAVKWHHWDYNLVKQHCQGSEFLSSDVICQRASASDKDFHNSGTIQAICQVDELLQVWPSHKFPPIHLVGT